ncbi:MAG TPA: SpoIVB peptidase S55 domain-containing protein, partial [Acidobacteriota bacterium]|nr:SpoIVB peptidase S55 domain-containing protein [Acidobacteriota bacterium]
AATAILPLSQVKPGMKGKGRSVFAGTKVEEFDVEVIGLLANTQAAKRNVILARLSGRGLEATGVIGGMSGSPVYVDGKIIGAVAFSFSYAKEPIAGITPIEEMLADGREPRAAPRTGFSLEAPIRETMTLEDLAGLYRSALQARQAASSGEQAVVPLGVPLVFGGFSSWAYEKAKPFFADIGFRPVRSGSAGQVLPGQKAALPASIQEGDAVGVQLIGGDLDLTAVGTATYVDGNRVVAFGHPLYNLGGVDYAMTKATVLTVVPSLESSFKLAASGPVIGRFSQDRTSGVTGQIGLTPRLIPLNITIQGDSPERREFKLKIVDDKFLSPALVNMAVSSLITAEERAYGNLSLEFNGDIFLDKGASLHLEDLFSGNYDTSATSLSSLLAAVVYYLNNNEFRDVGIYRIDLNVKALEETRQCFLEKVLLDKYEVSPGEKIGIKVFLRTAKEESLAEDITLVAPPLPAGSDFQIVIGDAASMQQVERSQYRIQEFVPRSLAQLLRILGNLRKNNRVYFKVLAAKPGLFLKGEELPNLPPTLKAMFASPRASSPPATELTRSTLTEYQLPLPYVFRGGAVIPVKIRR